MKKVGLLTFHETTNFGSMLQTYGLYKAIEQCGHECEVINYKCEAILSREIPKSYRFKDGLKGLAKEFLIFRTIRKKYHCLLNFLNENIKLSPVLTRENLHVVEKSYDIFMVGSDIVWGLDITQGDTSFFLDFINDNSKKYAFSSSIGNRWSSDEEKKVKPLLSGFRKIAVRELEAADWVESLVKKEVDVVCDPTMLLTRKQWEQCIKDDYSDNNYVLVYFDTPNHEVIESAKSYARKRNSKVLFINYGLPIRGVSNIKPTTISQFLALIKNAERIFTASYHGMLFSIYFEKQFDYFNRAHKSRMNSLARQLCVETQEGDTDNNVDYLLVSKKVDAIRIKSLGILKSYLNQ